MGWYSGKTESDSLKKLSVRFLHKNRYFCGWNSGMVNWSSDGEKTGSVGIMVSTRDGDEYLKFNYTQTDNYSGEKKDFDYRIPLTTTDCHFGGRRYWFICPLFRNGVYCGRRVGVLYKGGDYFGCRHCYNLTYYSRNEGRRFRNSPIGYIFKLEEKIEKLEEGIKRQNYRGVPTKRYRKLMRYYNLLGRVNTSLSSRSSL